MGPGFKGSSDRIELGPAGQASVAIERPRSVDWLVVGLLIVSAMLSLASLALRNLFDDEILSLPFVVSPVREIVATAAAGDVHPPGMYLLAHAGWRLLGSYRWLNLLPLAIFYAGLSAFVLEVAPLLHRGRERVMFVALATLHPQVLLWSNTYRWYCPWTGLALLTLVWVLQPSSTRPGLNGVRTVGAGVALAGLFYLNYMTVLFGLALAVGVWVRFRRLMPASQLLGRMALGGGVAGVLIAPQLRVMFAVHLANAGGQRSNVGVSGLRMVQAIVGSEAYLPWRPIAVCAALVLGGVAVWWMIGEWRRGAPRVQPISPGVKAVLVFGGCLFVLIAASGLGGKPRNGLVLIPVLAPLFAIAIAALGRRIGAVVFVVLGAWGVLGAAHVVGSYGLQKADRNDRPGQVVSLVAREVEAAGDGGGKPCAAVFTYDAGLAFAMSQARVPGLLIVSPFRGPLFAGAVGEVPRDCVAARVYLVESYPAGLTHRLVLADEETKQAEEALGAGRRVTRLDVDPDAGRKRRLSALAGLETGIKLPDYRFVVVSGTGTRELVADLRSRMPHFVSGQSD